MGEAKRRKELGLPPRTAPSAAVPFSEACERAERGGERFWAWVPHMEGGAWSARRRT